MRYFELFIDDERSPTPTLMFVEMSDERRVLGYAREKLQESRHYRGIEVFENGLRLFGLGSLADGPAELS